MVSNGVKINWLWDSRIGENEVKKILKDKNHPKFNLYAEKLLSRVSDPKMVFSMVDKVTFCKKWPSIKKQMIKDRWLKSKVAFWQTIYERIQEKLKNEGVKIRQSQGTTKIPSERMKLAQQIKKIRLRLGYTQKEIAKKLGVNQQYISKIENGRENVSVDTLRKIANALGKRLIIRLK